MCRFCFLGGEIFLSFYGFIATSYFKVIQPPAVNLVKSCIGSLFSQFYCASRPSLNFTQFSRCVASPLFLHLARPLLHCLFVVFNSWIAVPVVQTMQGGECLFEAVEQQDLDTVQILLYQFSADELDLNTPNSQGLTPLDIAIMTNNTPIAKLLLKAGGKESPHCE